MSAVDEYWMRVCEADAEWACFCKYPSQTNWDSYVRAKKAERDAATLAGIPQETEGGQYVSR